MAVVIVKCVGCGAKKTINPGEVGKWDQPMCDICYMPMIVEQAKSTN